MLLLLIPATSIAIPTSPPPCSGVGDLEGSPGVSSSTSLSRFGEPSTGVAAATAAAAPWHGRDLGGTNSGHKRIEE